MTSSDVNDEKVNVKQNETAHDAAERGHAATDQYVSMPHIIPNNFLISSRYGRSLIEFDKAAESRLRLKIDLYIVPTVALLYLFCFIDRANIGSCYLYTSNDASPS